MSGRCQFTSDETGATHQEKCIVLAEWLGWKPNESRTRWHSPACQRSEVLCDGKAPNFYSDEAANALILEKMPNGTQLHKLKEGWVIYIRHIDIMGKIFDHRPQELRVLIADAGYALALREREGR